VKRRIPRPLGRGSLFNISFSAHVKLVKLTDGPFTAPLPSVLSLNLFRATGYLAWVTNSGGDTYQWTVSFPPDAIAKANITLHTINATCTTPSFPTVLLPMINQSDFTGQTAGEVDFKLEFTNCPPYMTNIHFRAEASGGVSPSPTNGLLPLTTGSTASGVVVQVLRGLTGNTPLTLDQWTTLSQYDKSASISQDFTLPFRARYYRTSPNITPGKVKAAMIVHIQYQ